MAEFEKFKRRVIRSVARKTLVEKKTEEEVWSELKAETKCDCKQLWERMRALTLKKLRRLLLADDKLESIIPIAQMSLTDWLLFDLVLVHENIDVIGRNILEPKADLGPLQELVDLINEFNIEGKQGEALVAAWTLVTYNYNNRGRQCSPMLLQRRWFQIKQQIRQHFYGFWYKFRGNTKILDKAKVHMPSMFEMKIAKQYPYIVTKKFLEWDKLIEQNLVILPQEFENKFRSQCTPKSASKNDGEPDVVLLERNIETIEVADADSDTENAEKDSDKTTTGPTKTDPKTVVVKTEPQDDAELTQATKSITVEQLAEELRKRDTQLLEHISNIEDDDKMDVDKTRNEENILRPVTNEDNAITPITNETEENVNVNIGDGTSNNIADVEPMMPQITNVFGNVTVETDMLAKISKAYLSGGVKTASNIQNKTTAAEPMEVNDSEVDEKLKSFLDNQIKSKETLKLNNESTTTSEEKNDVKNIFSPSDVENARVTNPFLGVPIDLTFTDDGVELVDDGIEYDEDEDDIIKPFYKEDADVKDNSNTKAFNEEKVQTVEASDSKFDLKLLMLPIVYTTRINDMAVLKNVDVSNIKDKQIIETVFIESKPVMKQDTCSIEIKENIENKDSSLTLDDNNCKSSGESDSESEVPEHKKVKPSSYLLQKPRSRSYNPIQLCKNPDFNTRLKRLTVGFLSSTRNRAMLKTLKPMTIDISKAFEKKLVNGTLYLKNTDTTTPAPQIAEENEQVNTVLPSAMSVQSLIDQTPPQQLYLENSKEKNVLQSQKKNNDEHVIERNKNINLPDIDKIRKMNQRLYVAEVTPMRVKGSAEPYTPPVKILNKEQDSTSTKATSTMTFDKNSHLDQQAKLMKKSNYSNFQAKYYREKRNEWSTVSWLAKSVNTQKEFVFDDALITLDTLSKMINVIICNNNASMESTKKLKKSEKKAFHKNQAELEEREKLIDYVLNKPLDENALKEKKVLNVPQPQASEQTELRKEEFTESKKPEHEEHNKLKKKDVHKELPKTIPPKGTRTDVKTPKIIVSQGSRKDICCWAREKLINPSGKRRHLCPRICKCCCREELAGKLKKIFSKTKSITISDDEETPQTQPKPSPIESTGEKLPVQAKICIKWIEPEKVAAKRNSVENNVITIDESEQVFTASNQIPEMQLNINTMEIPSSSISIEWNEPENTVTESNSFQNNVIAVNDSEKNSTLAIQEQVQPKVNTTEIPSSNIPRINILSPAALGAPRNIAMRRDNKLLIPVTPLKRRRTTKVIKPVECQPITFTTDQSDHSLKKILYLNSNHIETGKGAPIYLGPNKVLLTDGPVPPVLGNSNVPNIRSEAETPVSLPDLSLPEGVRVVILPNGNVSFVVDENVNLDTEKLSQLPTILQAVRRYLMKTKTSNEVVDLNGPVPEVINLSDDETLENNEKTDSDLTNVKSSLNNSDTPSTENNETIINETVPIEKESGILPNIQVNPSVQESTEQTLPPTSDVTEPNLDTEGRSAKEVVNTTECITGSNSSINVSPIVQNISAGTEPKNPETAKNINEGDAVLKDKDETNLTDAHTNSNMNRKTLLSDLMEMSGISMEDVTPTVKENSVQETLPIAQVAPTIAAPKTDDMSSQTNENSFPIIGSNRLAQLTPVYTFSQLKYACEHNYKFFTLDLQTGVISVINVFIKNKSKTIHTNQKLFIDLTDDQDGPTDIRDSRSLLKANTSEGGRAQPLKLFKSGGLNVGILNRKPKRSVKVGAIEATIPAKRLRKEPLDVREAEIYDSSDEEPLSTISKRMRMEDVQQPVVNNTPSSEMDITNSNDLDKYVEEQATEEQIEYLREDLLEEDLTEDLSQEDFRDNPEDKVDAEIENEISFLCDDTSDNDDCILGF